MDDALAKFGDFEETTVTGAGDDVIDLPAPGFPCIMKISHSGSRNFIVHIVDTSGNDVDLLINTIASYSGVVTDYERFSDAAMLSISADGNWSVTFKPLKSMARLENGGQIRGDCVAHIVEASLTKVNISNSGERNFIVRGIGLTRSILLVDEIGPYDGKVVWSQPPAILHCPIRRHLVNQLVRRAQNSQCKFVDCAMKVPVFPCREISGPSNCQASTKACGNV